VWSRPKKATIINAYRDPPHVGGSNIDTLSGSNSVYSHEEFEALFPSVRGVALKERKEVLNVQERLETIGEYQRMAGCAEEHLAQKRVTFE